jgi:hypothetical protein
MGDLGVVVAEALGLEILGNIGDLGVMTTGALR